ncbi:hypothetical protein ACFWMS_26365 [Peribacillus butanolivorans]|uniref:hypothetical protein n=1 Tax=Peribacillus butanolivorans TaxID=421767 RepID=UPI0036638D76
MGTMKTFNAEDWTPVPLVAPDGRTYTPGDHAEHRELLTLGYAVAPLAPKSEPATDTATLQSSESDPAGTETSQTKPKTNRRNGGQQ